MKIKKINFLFADFLQIYASFVQILLKFGGGGLFGVG